MTGWFARGRLAALIAALLLAPLALSGPAQAEKAKNTLRIAFDQPIRLIDGYLNPNPEGDLVNRAVFDTLVGYDVATKTYHGQIAESWKQIDDKTLELTLRRGEKFSDGTPVTIDDVLYSFQYAMDPSANFLFKDSRFGWIDKVEKVDDDTIRVVAKEPTAIMLSRLWAGPEIVPQHVHQKLADRATFGLHPVGSGPYEVESFDPATGNIVLVANPLYDTANYEPAAKIGRIEITTIPDAQTQYAKVLVGDLDLIFNVDYDEAKNLVSSNPDYKIVTAPTISYSYILFDTADRTGIHVFKDIRVREALLRAIDVAGMRKAMLPPEFAAKPAMQAMCLPAHVGCAWTEAPVSYDPAKAKQLLAEAGLADGFDLTLSTWGPARPVAEAVAGDFRKIGVRASVSAMPINAFQTARGQGKLQTMVTQWDNGGGVPDIDTTAEFYFPPSTRNYIGDPEMATLTDAAARELDPKKREALYAQLFDRATAQRYMMPLVEFPAIMVLSKDLAVDSNHLKPEGFLFNRLSWTK